MAIEPSPQAAQYVLATQPGDPVRVLVFPVGTEISFEIYAALKNEKWVELIGAAAGGISHAHFLFEKVFEVDHVAEPTWLPQLIDICVRERVRFILPAHDDAIVALARHAAKIPATIVTSDRETCEISRSKSKTYETLCDIVRTPRVYAADQVDEFPVFAKPDRGQGSADTRLIRNARDLETALVEVPQCLISEYLPGEEYTVDCFSDRDGGVLFAGARMRRRTRNGIAVNTICVDLPEAFDLAKKIQGRIPFRGAWFFQVKRARDGTLALLETAPRIAGSMAAHRVRGVNFALLGLYEAMRVPVQVRPLNIDVEMDRALTNRYKHNVDFTHVFVDLDDTLVVKGHLNVELAAFLFRCATSGKPVVLITRHADDVTATLAKYRIAQLFDQVVHLLEGEPKSEHVEGERPLFIDDSFRERAEVARATNAWCFDLSMMEMLYQASV